MPAHQQGAWISQGVIGFALIVMVIITGLIILLATVRQARAIIRYLPHERQWRILYKMMCLSCGGYVIFAIVILTPYHLLHGWVTALVFLGGSVFAWLVVGSTLRSIQNLLRLRELELQLEQTRSLEELHQRLTEAGMKLTGADGCLLEWQEQVYQLGENAPHALSIPISGSGQTESRLAVYRHQNPFGSDEELLLRTLLHHAIVVKERLQAIHVNQRRIERLLVEQMSDGVLMADPQGNIVLANPAILKMLGRPDVHSVGDLIPLGLDLLAAQKTLTESSESVLTRELHLDTEPPRVMLAKTALLTDIKASLVGSVTTLMDITQERELQAMKEDFLASVSHELRTPVTAIVGYSELLQEEDIKDGQRNEFVAIIGDSAKRLFQLINDLLDLTKLEAGMMKMNLQPVSLVPLVERTVAQIKPLALQKHQKIEVNLPAGLPPVPADSHRIAQVLTNLIGNAIKFTPDGERITISASFVGIDPAEPGDDYVQLSIADTGPGIPPQDRERIFEKYQQVENKWTYGIKGTGLGLPIAKQIVERHGGRIWVDSAADKGSIFHFTLPFHS